MDKVSDLIKLIVSSLVDSPDEIQITEVAGDSTTVYELKVAKDDLGKIIGKIGNTGRSTGKHLHYEIKVNDKARNPKPFLKIGKNVFKKF